MAPDIEPSAAACGEWSPEHGTWRELDRAGDIEDPALEVPLPISALVHAAKVDDAVQRALIAKANPVLTAHIAKHREEAKAEGKVEALLTILAARGVAVGDAERTRILGERDPAQLERWLTRAATCAQAAELFTTRS
jgi:hypothetical protein